MADDTTPTADATTEVEQPEQLGESGVKALQAERKARAAAEKHANELAQRIKAFEEEKLSDLERAQEAAREYEAAAQKAQVESLRWRTAAKYGINDEDAEVFLTGSDEETITLQAERLSSLSSAPSAPRPDPSQGAKGSIRPKTTAEQFAEALGDF